MSTGNMDNSSVIRQTNDSGDGIPGYTTLDAFTQAGFKAVMETTRSSNHLPMGHNWDLYSNYPSFQRIMNFEGNRILKLISMVLHHQGTNANILRRDMEEKFEIIVDANDTILERVGCNLDELAGIRRNPEPVLIEAVGQATHVVSGSWNHNIQASESVTCNFTPQQTVRLLTAKNIQRPQVKFRDTIDNSSNPFEPRIKYKPNSMKPLSIVLEITNSGESFSHPYEYELNCLKIPESQLKKVEPRHYLPLSDTPLVIIECAEDISILMADLKNYTEIAVDLEHHSYRTFQGITCLMQISTCDTDYIIDTLELRDKLHCLNEVFTNTKVVKVFHGSDHDIEWLQRDLSLYVVNMFDTHQAARLLNFAHLSLAYLLKHYCNISVNKHFQFADWRIRPLPEELVTYARGDTHYLLYVYDRMKNALLEAGNGKTNMLMAVIQRSTELCKKRYEKHIFKEDSHMDLYRRNKKLFDNRQLFAFRELFRWRDKMARQEDESIGYILPNHMLLQISEVLPREMQGIMACCNPIPPVVRQNLTTLHQIVLKAREQSLVRPIIDEETQVRPATQAWVEINWECPLYCPHDLTRKQDFREDLPTLLNPSDMHLIQNTSEILVNKKPSINIFELLPSKFEINDDSELSVVTEKQKQITFVSPYERYKLVRPFLHSQEQDGTENKMAVNKNEDSNESRIHKIKEHFINMSLKMEELQNTEDTRHTINIQGSGKRKFAHVDLSQSSEDLAHTSMTKHPKLENVPSFSENAQKRKQFDRCPTGPKMPVTLEEASVSSMSKPKIQIQNQIQKTKETKTEFQPYDYSKVDFARFQGGSTVSYGCKNTSRGKFRLKGKKSKFIGKTNHKSFTYGKGQR